MNHSYFAIPGVTDPADQRATAERRSRLGDHCTVHDHRQGEPCRDTCTVYEPAS